MKKIPLSQGRHRPSKHNGLFAIVDDDDYDWLMQWNWTAIHSDRKSGGYAMRVQYGVSILMHRIIMDATDGSEIDHINGNGLDNRRENLRIATHSQNMSNRDPFCKSGYKGVYKEKNGKWRFAFVCHFDTAEEAAKAYDKCAIMFYGKHARLNFPES